VCVCGSDDYAGSIPWRAQAGRVDDNAETAKEMAMCDPFNLFYKRMKPQGNNTRKNYRTQLG